MEEIILKFKKIIKKIDYKKYIFMIILFILYIFLFVYVKFSLNKNNNNIITNETIDNVVASIEEKQEEKEYIFVDIKGEVKKPGVYKLEKGSRVNDAIKKAGNLTKEANTRFINLAKEIIDGDAIVIYSNKEIKDAEKTDTIVVNTPCECEKVNNDACLNDNTLKKTETDNKKTKNNELEDNKLININNASLEELMSLTGIGEAKATAIIKYREENGKFNKIEDIINVSGISETIFNKIKENITV